MSNINVQYGENRQLTGEATETAENIGGFELRDVGICHDPKLLRTKKLFSYPRDKEIRKVSVTHDSTGELASTAELNQLFDLGKRLK